MNMKVVHGHVVNLEFAVSFKNISLFTILLLLTFTFLFLYEHGVRLSYTQNVK